MSMLARQPAARMPGVPVLLRELQRLEEGLGLGSGASAATDEPTASVPPADPEPGLRTPDANRFRDRAPMQDTPRFARHGQARDGGEAFGEHDAMFMMDREPEPKKRSSGSRPGVFATLALVLAVLAIGLTVFLHYSPDLAERLIDASLVQRAPATAPAPSRPAAPAPVAEAPNRSATAPAAPQTSPLRAVDDARAEQEPLGVVSTPKPMPPEPLAAESKPSAQTESSVARESEQPATAGAAPAQEVPRATQPTANDPEPQPGGTARLIIAVSPQGEIYIDGTHHGTTPPITTFDLEPGMHRIEVRSGSRKPYLTFMTVQAGDVRRIRHDFNAKPSRPPR
jgi:hypothetical protein